MNSAAAFMVSLGQCLSTMALYTAGHPARERVVDAAFAKLVDLLADIQYADYSIIGDGVVFHGRVVEDLRNWDWASRLSGAGIERLEIDADVTRDGWVRALDELQESRVRTPAHAVMRGKVERSAHDARVGVAERVVYRPLAPVGNPREEAVRFEAERGLFLLRERIERQVCGRFLEL